MELVRKYFAATGLVAAISISSVAGAATISYNGYSLDTDTNIVTGGGLEWLQWDETVGISANDALVTYDGWRLANATEFASLLNSFNFGTTFDSSDMFAISNPSDSTAVLNFLELFGDNRLASGTSGDGFEKGTGALYSGQTMGYYSVFAIDYNDLTGSLGPVGSNFLFASPDFLVGDDAGGVRGVALVRSVSSVPVPAAAWLFVSGLIGLAGMARRKRL